MLSQAINKKVTETGPGSPCGALMRRYWQPAALVEELAPEQCGDRPVKPVTLLGEALVLFRDGQGKYGLVERHCPHRGADLAFGRCEDGGLRCTFHGWLFDRHGACLEQPAEPPNSNFHNKVRLAAYPCEARNGIVFAYLGPGSPPPLPHCDALAAPDEYSFAFKGHLNCNWLQALEVGIDPAHASFLHRFLDDGDRDQGLQFSDTVEGSDLSTVAVLREFDCPAIDVAETSYGLRVFARRELDAATTHIRVTNLLYPHAIVIPMTRDMIITQWHVPIDDTHSWWYAIFTSFDAPVDQATMRRQRLELYTLPDYKPRVGRANDYGFDAAEQTAETYTGMGHDINVHDQWAVESMGPIQDRAAEHLGASDKAIAANRKLLLAAIDNAEAGADAGDLPALNGAREIPRAVDTVGPSDAWRDVWTQADANRRARAKWTTPKPPPRTTS